MEQKLQYHLDLDPRSQWVFNTSGAAARENLIYVQEAGDFIAGPGYYTTREGFDSYLIKLTVSGCGLLRYKQGEYRVPAGSFYWIDCRAHQDYRTDPAAGGWRVLWVHLYGANAQFYYESFLQATGGEPVAALCGAQQAYETLRQLLRLLGSDAPQAEKDLQSAALLSRLLTQLVLCAMKPAARTQPTALMKKIRDYLDTQYLRKCTLAELGARFGLSPCYLQRQFKRCYGQSPAEYLMYLRIVRAKELLRTTRSPVSEVAYAAGFENAGYFSRLFKQQEGLTPQEYRHLWPSMETPMAQMQRPE